MLFPTAVSNLLFVSALMLALIVVSYSLVMGIDTKELHPAFIYGIIVGGLGELSVILLGGMLSRLAAVSLGALLILTLGALEENPLLTGAFIAMSLVHVWIRRYWTNKGKAAMISDHVFKQDGKPYAPFRVPGKDDGYRLVRDIPEHDSLNP